MNQFYRYLCALVMVLTMAAFAATQMDNIKPEVSIEIDGMLVLSDTVFVKKGSNVQINAYDESSGIAEMKFSINGVVNKNREYKLDKEDTTKFKVFAKDSAGNECVKNVYVRIEKSLSNDYQSFLKKQFPSVDSISFFDNIKIKKINGKLASAEGWTMDSVNVFLRKHAFIFGLPTKLYYKVSGRIDPEYTVVQIDDSISFDGVHIINGHIQVVIRNGVVKEFMSMRSFGELFSLDLRPPVIDKKSKFWQKFKSFKNPRPVLALETDISKLCFGYQFDEMEGMKYVTTKMYNPKNDTVFTIRKVLLFKN